MLSESNELKTEINQNSIISLKKLLGNNLISMTLLAMKNKKTNDIIVVNKFGKKAPKPIDKGKK